MTRPAFAFLLAAALGGCVTIPAERSAETAPVTLRIVGLNDFHGNLEPLNRPLRLPGEDGTVEEVKAAGAAFLAGKVAEIRDKGDPTLVIAAGDLIGGSPLSSSLFLDEPAIGAMNRIGLDFNAVGNHEFDRGWRELKRIQEGGCAKFGLRDPCQVENPYAGADFTFLAANVLTETGATLFPAYGIKRVEAEGREMVVGVIGLTLTDTPTLVTPSGVEGLTFADEATTINALVPELERAGADAIVVAIHQGLYTEVGYNDKSCGGVSGPLIDILKRVDPRVDVVISGHTHRAYVCDFSAIDPERGFLVTSAGHAGAFLTEIVLAVDPVAGDVVSASADNLVVAADGALARRDEAVAAYVDRYVEASREAAKRVVGRISGPAPKPGPATEETALGNLLADAHLHGTREAGAEIAMMNNSGIRADLEPAADGTVTFGDIYRVQPFGNTLVTKSFTGAQLLRLLEQQFDKQGFVQTFSVSEGFAFSYDMRRPVGERVISASLNGEPIDPARSYRVSMNSFLASGGDSFTVFEEGTDTVTGALDLEAVERYLGAQRIRILPATGRVTRIDGGGS